MGVRAWLRGLFRDASQPELICAACSAKRGIEVERPGPDGAPLLRWEGSGGRIGCDICGGDGGGYELRETLRSKERRTAKTGPGWGDAR